MRFEQFYYFVKIADLHSFSAASSYLFVSQQALSTSIKNLEKTFHTTLFVRTPRGVVLSDEGQYFYDIARKMLSLYEDLHYHFLVEPDYTHDSEPLTIALNSSIKAFYFTKIISYFYKSFPSFEVNYLIKKNEEVIDTVLRKEADFGVIPILKINDQLQIDIPDSLHYIPFHESRFSLLTNLNSPLSNFKSISISTIVKYPLILNDFSVNGESLFHEVLEYTGKKPNIIMADSFALLTQLVEDNVGHTIIPDSYPLPSTECIKIPITDNIAITTGFIHAREPLTEFQKLYVDKSINLIEKDMLS